MSKISPPIETPPVTLQVGNQQYAKEISDPSEIYNIPQGNGTIFWSEIAGIRLRDAEKTLDEWLAEGFSSSDYNTYQGTTGFPSITSKWAGSAYDPVSNKQFFHSGGHYAYGGNEIVAVNYNNFTVERIVDPSEQEVHNDPSNPPGYIVSPYPDGTPPASHSYSHLFYDAVTGYLVNDCSTPWGIGGVDSIPDPDYGGDGEHPRGLFSAFPIDQAGTDTYANKDLWLCYYPPGYLDGVETTNAPNFEDTFAFFDRRTQRMLVLSGSSIKYIDYLTGGAWQKYQSNYKVDARAACSIMRNQNEIWAFGRDTWTAEGQAEMTLRIADIGDYEVTDSIPDRWQLCTGEQPPVYGITHSGTAQVYAPFPTCFTHESRNYFYYWRYFFSNKNYTDHATGQLVSQSEKDWSPNVFWRFNTQYQIEKIETDPASLAWVQPHENNQASIYNSEGGSYTRMIYLFDDFVAYVHGVDLPILIGRLPK